MSADDNIYVGTDDASLLRVTRSGGIERLPGFERVAGRDKWYAGTALIDGKVVGPPLGVRSITATSDGSVLLANVHVGGIPRSVDGGATWQPTIDIESDVHEVRAHPSHPNVVAAAMAIGLCISTDAGATWQVEQRGLHALHCSAVAFAGDDILVSTTADPFAPEGAIDRGRPDERSPLVPSPAACPRGSTVSPILVASQRTVWQPPSLTETAICIYRPTMVAHGRIALATCQPQ